MKNFPGKILAEGRGIVCIMERGKGKAGRSPAYRRKFEFVGALVGVLLVTAMLAGLSLVFLFYPLNPFGAWTREVKDVSIAAVVIVRVLTLLWGCLMALAWWECAKVVLWAEEK